jgi:hypothetical protein
MVLSRLCTGKFLKEQERNVIETGTANDIGDLNLAYLLLAKRLVSEDIALAMYRLGMSRELADLLGSLSLSQIVKLAGSSLLLCRFRFDDHPDAVGADAGRQEPGAAAGPCRDFAVRPTT